MQPAHRRLLVVVHDVAPPFLGPLEILTGELHRLVGSRLAGAVVPDWHGSDPVGAAPGFAAYVRASFGEVLLHGFSHRAPQPRGPVALLTDGADEFGALTPTEAARRLRLGRRILTTQLGLPIHGFVPPAWQPGPATPALLEACGLTYRLGFRQLAPARGAALPLAVWSWDCGRIAAAGLAGEALGRLRQTLRPDAIPCIVLHPRDLARGYLPRALCLIEQLLQAGSKLELPGHLQQRI